MLYLSKEIIFTGGGSESNNIVLKGLLSSGDHLLTSSYEHPSVLGLSSELEKEASENIQHIREIGTRWAIKQSEELINAGVPVIHYYLMNDTSCMLDILNHLHK